MVYISITVSKIRLTVSQKVSELASGSVDMVELIQLEILIYLSNRTKTRCAGGITAGNADMVHMKRAHIVRPRLFILPVFH